MKMANKNIIITILILLATLSFVSADFTISVNTIVDNVKPGESAQVELTIHNNGAESQTYTILKPSKWKLRSDPLTDYFSGMTVAAGASKTTSLSMTPEKEIETSYGLHAVELQVKSEDGETQTASPRIFLESGQSIEYVPNIIVKSDVMNEGGEEGKINPQEPIKIVMFTENRNSLNVTDYTIKIKSSIINTELTSSLGPYDTKTVETTVNVDKYTAPQEVELEIILIKEGKEIGKFYKTITIMPAQEEFATESSTTKAFLKRFTTIKVTNTGNVQKTGTVTQPTTFIKSMFTKTEPKSTKITKDDARYVEWTVTLNAGETKELKETQNYMPLLWAGIILLILIIVYQFIKPEVIIKKSIVNAITKEGGITEIKVLLLIKNISNKEVRSLRITDKVPNIAVLIKEEEAIGTMAPKRVKSLDMRGTIVEWELPELIRHEERIIRYKIRTKLSVLGEIKLPMAEITYEAKPGKKKTSYSDRPSVHNE
jgi:hypothetical protein